MKIKEEIKTTMKDLLENKTEKELDEYISRLSSEDTYIAGECMGEIILENLKNR